jgi:hypothetical protein
VLAFVLTRHVVCIVDPTGVPSAAATVKPFGSPPALSTSPSSAVIFPFVAFVAGAATVIAARLNVGVIEYCAPCS